MSSWNMVPTRTVAIIAFSAIVGIMALAGLIMDASGVPYFSEAQDYDDSGNPTEWESQDWEECCEEDYEDSSELESLKVIFSPLTTFFVLVLIFSILCMLVAAIPIPSCVKSPLVTLFGLATGTVGIFLVRKLNMTLGFFLQLSSNQKPELGIQMHVMPYFGGLLGVFCILLGGSIVAYLFAELKRNNIESKSIVIFGQNFLAVSLLVFLFSPVLPIGYISADKDYEYYDETKDVEGEYLFPVTLFVFEDRKSELLEDIEDIDDDDEKDQAKEALETIEYTASNYVIVDNIFLALIWVNLSIFMLMSLALIPKIGFVFEHIAQLNILSIGLLILAFVLAIIMYVNMPDLLSEESERYDEFSFHVNWIMPIACVYGIFCWTVLLAKSHIPWWRSLLNKKVPSPMNHSSKTVYSSYSNPAQQNYAQQQQYIQQQQYGQQNRGPPRF